MTPFATSEKRKRKGGKVLSASGGKKANEASRKILFNKKRKGRRGSYTFLGNYGKGKGAELKSLAS